MCTKSKLHSYEIVYGPEMILLVKELFYFDFSKYLNFLRHFFKPCYLEKGMQNFSGLRRMSGQSK